ncbi:helix-turn-helix domain-containing protein [Streptomyces longwoodensis]|uniref:AlbA family DNA-binding domain-containing protein n=1 Tax=Streptomyces longwoodensis TaxID=68231 RepID=UPI0036EDFCB2
MVTKSIEGVRQALRDRKFDELLGLRECDWLDVKSGPYQLTQPLGAEELAKDVAAFANTVRGGLLLIGFKTVADHDSEIISDLRPIPRSLVDLDRHRKLIHERITPTVRDLHVEWIDYEGQKGVLCINIPAQPAGSRPFAVPGPNSGRGRSNESSVAVPLRVDDGTHWLPKGELQRLLAAGWSARGGPGVAPVTQNQASDRNKAARLIEAIPVDAQWIKAQKNVSMHRVSAWVSEAAFTAQRRLTDDIVHFLDPDVAAAHEALTAALHALCEELAGMFPAGPSHHSDRYAEIPPEWKMTDPARYRKALDDLTSASDNFLDKFQQCVNLLNKKGLLPSS